MKKRQENHICLRIDNNNNYIHFSYSVSVLGWVRKRMGGEAGIKMDIYIISGLNCLFHFFKFSDSSPKQGSNKTVSKLHKTKINQVTNRDTDTS